MNTNKISLIANSGLQFYRFNMEIDPNADITKSVRFYEWFDTESYKIKLEYAHYLPAEDVYVSKRSLLEEGYLIDGKLAEEINLIRLKKLTPDVDCFSINDIETPLEYFENKWIPIPFFEKNNSGSSSFYSTNWVRLKIVPIEKIGAKTKYSAVIVFDTKVDHENANIETPRFIGNDISNDYGLCNNMDLLLDYCGANLKCKWVGDYLAQLVHEGIDNVPNDFPSNKYLGLYIYFINYLSKGKFLPEVKLYSDNVDDVLNIDLVLDIGNSRTCGLLFDSSDIQNPFSKVKELILNDLSSPENVYKESFEMTLAFHKAKFGEVKIDDSQFAWPSLVRIGKEANYLIYQAQNKNEEGKDKANYHSSPKRYLWDNAASDYEWEFIQLFGTNPNNSVWIDGISQQLNSDGTICEDGDFANDPNYTKQSLMRFVFLEILAQAHVQINSYAFRSEHGNFSTPRKLRRIVVTCPTAMPRQEQIILRECAFSASTILNRYYRNSFLVPLNKDEIHFKQSIEIIPSLKDLQKDLQNLEDKKDWSYDEATCNQLVFLYAEISERYLNKADQFIDLYGKTRSDLNDYSKKSLTIGSIDIGAGTTDLMINAYQFEQSGQAVLKPIPLFWESFNYAGDVLLKEVIQQIIIEGQVRDENDRGCIGVIQNHIIDNNYGNPGQLLNNFFGINNVNINYVGRQMRKDFTNQIAKPIAEKYLQLAQEKSSKTNLDFDDFFPEGSPQPQAKLLNYFEEHFGFKFTELKWKFSLKRVNEIIEVVFEPLLKKLSTVLFAKGCDFVLISGRPTSLHKIEDLFLKFYPVSPDRLITLNNYRVGQWYPFQNGNGYFTDQKSIVAVGAMIGLLGGKLDRLNGFRLDMNDVKTKLVSTSSYFGIYDPETKDITDVFMTPEINKPSVRISGLPTYIGSKRLATNSYPSKVMFQLDFNQDVIKENIKRNKGLTNEDEIIEELSRYKENLKLSMPFVFKLSREYRVDKEVIKIQSVLNKDKDDLSPKIFDLKLKTMTDKFGHWLDNGIFNLSIDERN